MKQAFLLFIICFPLLLSAQLQKVGHLTIFSEDGDKFYLILNGEKQNEVAQTNLRVEDLPQPYYNAKIVFSDATIPSISKNNLMLADAEGVMMDVTYKIRKDKRGKVKLNYYSAIPVVPNSIPPSGMTVYHFGQPNGTTQTTTTTTGNTVGANVNVNGLNMNVTITDPIGTTSTSTTTTTTTNGTGYNNNTNNNQSNSRNCNSWPMGQSNFNAAKKTIADASFEESKLSTAKTVATSNCLSTDQIVEICKLFGFEDSKLAFAKFAFKHCTDTKNYFKVNNVFSFDSSKEDLNAFISGE